MLLFVRVSFHVLLAHMYERPGHQNALRHWLEECVKEAEIAKKNKVKVRSVQLGAPKQIPANVRPRNYFTS